MLISLDFYISYDLKMYDGSKTVIMKLVFKVAVTMCF